MYYINTWSAVVDLQRSRPIRVRGVTIVIAGTVSDGLLLDMVFRVKILSICMVCDSLPVIAWALYVPTISK